MFFSSAVDYTWTTSSPCFGVCFELLLCLPIHFPKGVLCLDIFNLCLLALHLRIVYAFTVTQMPLGFGHTRLVVYCSFFLISTMPSFLSLLLKSLLTAYYVQRPKFPLQRYSNTENSYTGSFVRSS